MHKDLKKNLEKFESNLNKQYKKISVLNSDYFFVMQEYDSLRKKKIKYYFKKKNLEAKISELSEKLENEQNTVKIIKQNINNTIEDYLLSNDEEYKVLKQYEKANTEMEEIIKSIRVKSKKLINHNQFREIFSIYQAGLKNYKNINYFKDENDFKDYGMNSEYFESLKLKPERITKYKTIKKRINALNQFLNYVNLKISNKKNKLSRIKKNKKRLVMNSFS